MRDLGGKFHLPGNFAPPSKCDGLSGDDRVEQNWCHPNFLKYPTQRHQRVSRMKDGYANVRQVHAPWVPKEIGLTAFWSWRTVPRTM